jgi:hypothetical protein
VKDEDLHTQNQINLRNNTTQDDFKNIYNFCLIYRCAESEFVFRFFPARQIPEIEIENPQWIFLKHWKYPNWVALERDHKVFYEFQVYKVFLVLSLVFKTVFGMFLAPFVRL